MINSTKSQIKENLPLRIHISVIKGKITKTIESRKLATGK